MLVHGGGTQYGIWQCERQPEPGFNCHISCTACKERLTRTQYLQLCRETFILQLQYPGGSRLLINHNYLKDHFLQVLDHKEVLTLAPRQETNLANDLLEKTSVKTIDHTNAQWTWTWRWRLCIWEGWWWRRCIPTKGPCCQPPEPPWLRTIEIWFSFCSDFSLTLLTLDCKTDHIPLEQNMVLKLLLLIFEVKKTSRAKPT